MKSEKLLENASANPDSKIRFLEEGFYVVASEEEEYLYSDDGVFIAKGNNCSVINGGFYAIRQNGAASLFDQSGKLIHSGAEGYSGSKDSKIFVAHSTGKYEILDDEGAVTALMPSLPEFLDSGCYCVKAKKGWILYDASGCKIAGPANEYIYIGRGWHTEEFKHGQFYIYNIIDDKGNRLYEGINGIQLAEDGSYVISAGGKDVLYDAGGRVKVGPRKSIELGDDGRYILFNKGKCNVFASGGELLFEKLSFVQLELNGWFSTEAGGIKRLYDANCCLIHEKADAYHVFEKGWFVVCRDKCQTLYSPDNKPLLSGNAEIWRYSSGNWFSIEYLGKYFGLCGDEYLSWKKQLAALIGRQKPMNKSQDDYYRSLWLLMI